MKAVASLAGHTNDVWSVAFSPDGQYIVSRSEDKLVKVWSVSGGKEVASLAGHASCVYRSPSVLMGNILFREVGEGMVYVCEEGGCVAGWTQHIISGSGDNLVKVWSVSARKEIALLAGHTNVVCSVAFSPDGQHIVSGSFDKLVKVWSVSGGKEVASRFRWLDSRMMLIRSPSVLMGNILFREVATSWCRCGREWNFVVYCISHYC
jgi:WD40 repeat protein